MPGGLTLLASLPANIPNPPAGKVTIFFNITAGQPYYKDSTGTLFPLGTIGATGPAGPTGPPSVIPVIFFEGADGEDGIQGPPGVSGSGGSGNISGVTPNTAPLSGWTGVNTGANWTATNDGLGGIQILNANNASLNWRLLTKSVPGTPYILTGFYKAQQWSVNSQTTGFYFYDGTKLMGIEVLTQDQTVKMRVQKINDVNTDGSTSIINNLLVAPSSGAMVGLSIPCSGIWMRLANSGTTLTFSWSVDGINWMQLFSEAAGTFITPTKYGFGGINVSGPAPTIVMNLISLVIT